MKRQKVLRHLSENRCVIFAEGKKHTRVLNPANGKKSVVPRHPEIKPGTVRAICRQLKIPFPTER